MVWFKKNDALEIAPRDPRFASVFEIREKFELMNDELIWLAEVITGDAGVAAECVTNATRLSENHSAIYRDWLAQWARKATVRRSFEHTRKEILRTADEKYQQAGCPHEGHNTLSSGEIAALQQWPGLTLAAHLDPLSRAVLILRGVEHAAIQDCALTLDVPRAAVQGAYCAAVGWLTHGTVSQFDEGDPRTLERPLQKVRSIVKCVLREGL